jgi:DNA-binding PadR family transcriptional regulator
MLKYLVLTQLLNGPASGYQVHKRIDDSDLWHTLPAPVYSALKTWLGIGAVSQEACAALNGRQAYAITPFGKQCLADWLGESLVRPMRKDALSAKLCASPADIPAFLRQLEAYILLLNQQVQNAGKKLVTTKGDIESLIHELNQKKILSEYRAELAWCEEVYETLDDWHKKSRLSSLQIQK